MRIRLTLKPPGLEAPWVVICIGILFALLPAGGCGKDGKKPSSPADASPAACFTTAPLSGTNETDFQVNASCSEDTQDSTSALQVRWDWENDGIWDTEFSTTKAASHRYATLGTKTILVEVRNTEGHTRQQTHSVKVIEAPPSPPEGTMVLIPPGTFAMGSPANESGREANETQHQVTLTRAYYLSDHEVTQAEWRAVMGWSDPYFHGDTLVGDRLPVEEVTWYDCIKYCNLRSAAEGLDSVYVMTKRLYEYPHGDTIPGHHVMSATVEDPDWSRNGYRLPTEAEWEYACRATSQSAFSSGEGEDQLCGSSQNLEIVGWFCGNAGGATHPVMGAQPNAWVLYDMHGNVGEWCWDRWDGSDHGSDPVTDPVGALSGVRRVFRGGSWFNHARNCRSAYRSWNWSEYRHFLTVGLRVARTASAE